MAEKKRKHFSDINPAFYSIAVKKEIARRHLKDAFSGEKFSKTIEKEPFPNLVASYSCHLIKRGPGIDLRLQENKAVNINLACAKLNGSIVHPGESFSFWRTVGSTTKRKGYMEGREIFGNQVRPGVGGGLCNLGNTVHLLVLHSPLDVTEIHNHSDALSPDEGERIPYATGTSVSYNNVDFRFKNNTNQDVQLLLWCDEDNLYGELRSREPFPYRYELVEEDHHFKKEDGIFYRNSKIYRKVIDNATGEVIKKELVLDNHSEVMFDYDLIPKELIRE